MTNPQNSRRQEMLDALPAASPHIVQKTGAHRNVVSRWLARLHAEGAVHVVDWIRWKGGPLPMYAAGPGVDVPCTIEPLPPAENYNRFKRQARADGRWAEKLARDRERAARRRDAVRKGYMRDPLLGAFFGKPRLPGV